jgi:hypothetical protein
MYKKQVNIYTHKTSYFLPNHTKLHPEELAIISEEYAVLYYQNGFSEVTVAVWQSKGKVYIKVEA